MTSRINHNRPQKPREPAYEVQAPKRKGQINYANLKRRRREVPRSTAPLLRTERKEIHGQLVEVKVYGSPVPNLEITAQSKQARRGSR